MNLKKFTLLDELESNKEEEEVHVARWFSNPADALFKSTIIKSLLITRPA